MPFRTPLDLYQDRLTALNKRRLLKPMSFSEVFDSSVRVIQLYGLRILLSTLVPTSICYLSLIVFNTFVLPTFFGAKSDAVLDQVSEVITAGGLLVFNIIPLMILGASFGMAFTSRLATRYMLGDKPDLDDIEQESQSAHLGMARTIGAMIVCSLWIPLVVVLAFLGITVVQQSIKSALVIDIISILLYTFGVLAAFLIPPILAGKVSLATSAFVSEGLAGFTACRRSAQLMKGSGHVTSGYGVLWGIWLLVLFIDLCLWAGFQGIFAILGISGYADFLQSSGQWGLLAGGAIASLPSFFVLWLTIPVFSAATTVLYYDRRVRMEAYDIRILSQDVTKANLARRNR